MVMFGFQGFAGLYLIHLAKDSPNTFPALCVLNAGMCYVGPQRGELSRDGLARESRIEVPLWSLGKKGGPWPDFPFANEQMSPELRELD